MRVVSSAPTQRSRSAEPVLIGGSGALRRVTEMARRIAGGNAKVLITGESGVGKDLLARLVHTHSLRAHQPFVPMNCASFSEGLLESELFGHTKGSFTGAYRDKIGKLQLAHRGTVFLDEIAEMSLRMQAMLLRFLESGEIQPVGADTLPTQVDVRVIAATNRDLPAMVARGEFREDLLYRIRVAHLHVPPLRDRREDIRPLVSHILERSGQSVVISEGALAILEKYHWPGNVRELQNAVEQMIAMADGPVIGTDHLPLTIVPAGTAGMTPARDRRRRFADDIFERLITGEWLFWRDVYPLFMNRDLTRADLRHLVGKGLGASGGNYRGVLRLFGVADADYKRFLNFLASHDCSVNFREFRASTRASVPANIPQFNRPENPPYSTATPTNEGYAVT